MIPSDDALTTLIHDGTLGIKAPEGVVVRRDDECPHPAMFGLDTNDITVNFAISGEYMPAIYGFLAHEVGHSIWSHWRLDFDKEGIPLTKTTWRVIEVFDEIRIEARAFNRGAAGHLRNGFIRWVELVTEEPDRVPSTPSGIAQMWALYYGRRMYMIASAEAVADVDQLARNVLGPDVVDQLVDLIAEAVAIEDDIAVHLMDLAEQWLALVPPDAEDEVFCICSGADSEIPSGADGSEGAPTTNEGENDSSDDGLDDLVRQAVKESLKAMKPQKASSTTDPRTMERVYQEKGRYTPHPPDAEVRSLAMMFARQLEAVTLPSITRIPVASAAPPGRIRSRELVRQSADRSVGRISTATPWERTKRRHSDVRPVTVGIATDVSGSMGWAKTLVAQFTYIVGWAAVHIGARVSAVTFGDDVRVTLKPGEIPRELRVVPSRDSTEEFDHALAALESVLHLTMLNREAKLLFVFSDGYLVKPGEIGRATGWLDKYHQAGARVVWVGLYNEHPFRKHPAVIPVESTEDVHDVMKVLGQQMQLHARRS